MITKQFAISNDWKKGIFPVHRTQNKYDKFKDDPETLAKIIAYKSLEQLAKMPLPKNDKSET